MSSYKDTITLEDSLSSPILVLMEHTALLQAGGRCLIHVRNFGEFFREGLAGRLVTIVETCGTLQTSCGQTARRGYDQLRSSRTHAYT